MSYLTRCGTMIVLASSIAVGSPVLSQPGGQSPLAGVQPGRWQLHDLDDRSVSDKQMCIADPRELLQLEHKGASCSRMVVKSDAKHMTVHYTCAAEGYAQTTLRSVSTNVVRVDTQGIVNGRPFNYRVDARRLGTCGGR